MVRPNGIAFSLDESKLYVVDTGRTHGAHHPAHMRVFNVDGKGKKVKGSKVFADCTAGLFDGFRLDDQGNIWTSAGDGVHCYAPDGTLIGKVKVPEVVANVCFGGAKLNCLYICRHDVALHGAPDGQRREDLLTRRPGPGRMTDTIHHLIEQYGLIAVFVACIAEGETAAILAGFFAHQGVFVPWQAFVAVFLGAFGGDTMFFLCGRRFADSRLRANVCASRPGFDRAFDLMQRHPALYVLGNRYVYGFRLVGGVAAGMSGIAAPKFVVLNAISALVWTILFGGIGYIFGFGAEQIIGSTLHKHQRLLIGLAIGLVVGLAGWYVAHRFSRRAAKASERT